MSRWHIGDRSLCVRVLAEASSRLIRVLGGPARSSFTGDNVSILTSSAGDEDAVFQWDTTRAD